MTVQRLEIGSGFKVQDSEVPATDGILTIRLSGFFHPVLGEFGEVTKDLSLLMENSDRFLFYGGV